MLFLFYVIFILIKVAILGCLYALPISMGIQFLIRRRQENKLTVGAIALWPTTAVVISTVLFVYWLTDIDNRGWGDSDRLSLGHGKYIVQVDYRAAYIEPNGSQVNITSFSINKPYLIARLTTERGNEDSSAILAWNLDNSQVQFLPDSNALVRFAAEHSITTPIAFETLYECKEKHKAFLNTWLLP